MERRKDIEEEWKKIPEECKVMDNKICGEENVPQNVSWLVDGFARLYTMYCWISWWLRSSFAEKQEQQGNED